jgi:DNA repair and recombination protein RAD54B
MLLGEYVVFITPTKLQLSIFARILNADKMDDLVEGSVAESLALINILTKISTSPVLLKATADKAKSKAPQAISIKKHALDDAVTLLPERLQIDDVSLSGTLWLHCFRSYSGFLINIQASSRR